MECGKFSKIKGKKLVFASKVAKKYPEGPRNAVKKHLHSRPQINKLELEADAMITFSYV